MFSQRLYSSEIKGNIHWTEIRLQVPSDPFALSQFPPLPSSPLSRWHNLHFFLYGFAREMLSEDMSNQKSSECTCCNKLSHDPWKPLLLGTNTSLWILFSWPDMIQWNYIICIQCSLCFWVSLWFDMDFYVSALFVFLESDKMKTHEVQSGLFVLKQFSVSDNACNLCQTIPPQS